MSRNQVSFKCIGECENTLIVGNPKFMDGIRCPECNGLVVPYQPKNNAVSDRAHYVRDKILERNIKHSFGLTPEQVEAVLSIADEYNKNQKKEPLLTIELQDETSAPKVIYKGEEIKFIQEVSFVWETDTDQLGGLTYAIQHYVKGEGYPVTNRIERQVKGHALV